MKDVLMEGADLSRANLEGVYMLRGVVSFGRMIETRLAGANLTGADAEGTDFTRADMKNSRVSGATLTGAKLIGADLAGADFSNAVGADYAQAKSLPASEQNPEGRSFNRMLQDAMPGK
jgi:uncharacterized protein YjbI with pentapeptide repeats